MQAVFTFTTKFFEAVMSGAGSEKLLSRASTALSVELFCIYLHRNTYCKDVIMNEEVFVKNKSTKMLKYHYSGEKICVYYIPNSTSISLQ